MAKQKPKAETITQRDLRTFHTMEIGLAALRQDLERKFARGVKIERGRFKLHFAKKRAEVTNA